MSNSTLPRVIGTSGVAFTGFNCVVGVGIFGLPGIVANVLGPAAIVAYLVCLVLFGLIALCLAEAGARARLWPAGITRPIASPMRVQAGGKCRAADRANVSL